MFFRGRGRIAPLFPLALAVSLAVTVVGCASTGAGGGTGSGTNVITVAAIEEISDTATDAYSVVSRLRPLWLRPRGTGSFGQGGQPSPLVVYLDGARYGSIDTLRSIDSNIVREMQYLSASEATTRFGTGHDQGAILVTSLYR